MKTFPGILLVLALAAPLPPLQGATPQAARPYALRTDSLTDPLGIDTPKPVLSWKLADPRTAARQTAYRIMVFSHLPTPALKPDIWDSGRVESAISAGVPYSGPTLTPSTRYFWRVQLWDAANKPYPLSAPAHWETGLMSTPWQARWIGDEPAELHAIRNSAAPWITNTAAAPTSPTDTRHDFRLHISLDRPIRSAILFTTGEDTAAAWVNDRQVLASQPLTPWLHMPWATYARQDITANLHPGDNLLAIEITRYILPTTKETPTHTPMSMCLYIVYPDGATQLITSADPAWKSTLDAPRNWPNRAFNDTTWPAAEPFQADPGDRGSRLPGQPWPTGPVAALRHAFQSTKPIVSARLYATALGAYNFRLNGAPVGDQVLAPGWMDYRQQVPYQVYDVTARIHPGPNALAAYLAPGWYSTPLAWMRQGNNYGPTQPALKAQLRLEHADGSVEWIATDNTWKADTSEITQAEIYDGETLDARIQQPGWDTARFNDAAWRSATIVTPAEPRIVPQYFQPIRIERTLTARAITSPSPGVYIFDFGQNMTALPDLHVSGPRGTDIRLRFAEILNPDGTMYTANLRTAKATDHFILAGSKTPEHFLPNFTFHGFRYAEITGLPTRPTRATLTAAVLHTDAPFTTRFSTGDPMVNQLWSNILWGQRSNFIGVPTDCPQRDERLGWSADAQVFWRTAAFNMDLTTFSQKYAADLRGTQQTTPMYGIYAPGLDTPSPGFGAAWSDAGVIVPWTGWIQSGNTRIIDENWDGMVRYLDEIDRQNPDHLWRKNLGIPFGDWLTPTITTPEDLIATAYFAYDVTLMRQMALATSRSVEAARYATLFEDIKTAFQKAYVRNDGFIGSVDRFPSIPPPTAHPEPGTTDKDHVVETQTGYVLALHMNLLPENLRAAAAERLIKKIEANHWLLGTGFLGTPYLLDVLSDTGHADVAYRLLLNREYPSWGYLIEHGATTTWERWNGDRMTGDPSMNSYNHYAYGAVAEWMYRHAAGVDTLPGDPGFHTIALHPTFDPRIGHLDLAYDSPYGTIHSAWSITGKQVTWNLTIPPNTTATLDLDRSAATAFTLNNSPIPATLPAGTYTIHASLKPGTKSELALSR